MLQQLQSLQDNMLKTQDQIASMEFSSTAGGGAVTATVTGERRLQSLAIAQEVIDPEDVEMLQDLVLAAVNAALEQVEEATAERMGAITGGLDIPGLP